MPANTDEAMTLLRVARDHFSASNQAPGSDLGKLRSTLHRIDLLTRNRQDVDGRAIRIEAMLLELKMHVGARDETAAIQCLRDVCLLCRALAADSEPAARHVACDVAAAVLEISAGFGRVRGSAVGRGSLIFDHTVAALLDIDMPSTDTRAAIRRQEALIDRLSAVDDTYAASVRMMLCALALAMGQTASGLDHSGRSMRACFQCMRLLEELPANHQFRLIVGSVLYPHLAVERHRHGDTDTARAYLPMMLSIVREAGDDEETTRGSCQLYEHFWEQILGPMAVQAEAASAVASQLEKLEKKVDPASEPSPEVMMMRRMAAAYRPGAAGEMADGLEGPAADILRVVDLMERFGSEVTSEESHLQVLLELLSYGVSDRHHVAWRATQFLSRVVGVPGASRAEIGLAVLFEKLAVRSLQQMRLDTVAAGYGRLDPFEAENARQAGRTLVPHLVSLGRLGEALRYQSLLDYDDARLPPPNVTDPDAQLDVCCPLTGPERDVVAMLTRRAGGSEDDGESSHQLLLALGGEPASADGTEAGNTERAAHEADPGLAFLSVIEAGTEVRATLSVRSGVERRTLTCSTQTLRSLEYEVLQTLVERRPGHQSLLHRLYELVVAPFAELLDRARPEILVVQAAGILRRIPFGVLFDGTRYLVERYAVLTHPGISAFTRGRGLSEPVRAETIAVPDAPNLPVLDRSVADCRALTKAIARANASGIAGFALARAHDVDAAYVEAALRRRPTVLHLSSHFEADQADAGRSGFILSDGTRFTLSQLARFDLSSIDLAILLGCETRAISDLAGERSISSADSLLLRLGAGAVVTTSWPVQEDVAHRVFQAFIYQVLLGGIDLARALQSAVLGAARDSATGKMRHPHDWGCLTLTGGYAGRLSAKRAPEQDRHTPD